MDSQKNLITLERKDAIKRLSKVKALLTSDAVDNCTDELKQSIDHVETTIALLRLTQVENVTFYADYHKYHSSTVVRFLLSPVVWEKFISVS